MPLVCPKHDEVHTFTSSAPTVTHRMRALHEFPRHDEHDGTPCLSAPPTPSDSSRVRLLEIGPCLDLFSSPITPETYNTTARWIPGLSLLVLFSLLTNHTAKLLGRIMDYVPHLKLREGPGAYTMFGYHVGNCWFVTSICILVSCIFRPQPSDKVVGENKHCRICCSVFVQLQRPPRGGLSLSLHSSPHF